MDTPIDWWVIVPMKDTRRAKSRLDGPSGERRELAIAMARDTLSAVVDAPRVVGILVVCQHADDVESFSLPGVTVIVREALDINAAILAGITVLSGEGVAAGIAILPGDLPYLRPTELGIALAQASSTESACVSDRPGTGTTLLATRSGHRLRPAYGPGSWTAHRAGGAADLNVPAWSGLRRDVDLREDLVASASLGRRTRSVLEAMANPRRMLENAGA